MDTKKPFEQIVTTHGAAVLRVCRAVLGPGPDADDAWSETFLAALRVYPDLAPDTNLQAWLVTVAHRKAIDVTRARTRVTPVGEPPDRVSSIGTPDTVDDAEIWQAVATLPTKQRQSVAYHYLGGLPYADIATLLGGTTDAARRAAADGIKKLRTALLPGNTRALSSKGATR